MNINYKRYLLEIIRPVKVIFSILIFLIILQHLNNFFTPYISKFVFDKFFVQKDYTNLVPLLMLYFLLYAYMGIQTSIHSFFRTKYLQSSNYSFRKRATQILFEKDFLGFKKYSFGNVATILKNNINSSNSLMLAIIETIFIKPLFLSISFFYLTHISPIFILFIILDSATSFIIVHFITKPIENAYKEQLKSTTLFNRHLEKTYNSYEDIRMNFISNIALVRLFRAFTNYKSKTIKVAKYDITYELLESLKGILFDMLIIIFSIHLIKNNAMTVGDYIAFISLKPKCVSALSGFAKLKLNFRKLKVFLDGIEKIIPLEEYYGKNIKDSVTIFNFDKIDSITFNDVSFSYKEKEPMFSNFSYKFTKNHIYIIEGDNGTGKTTFLRMLAKLCIPHSGKILFNNIPLSKISEQKLTGKIIILSQHPKLYDDTIQNNINIFQFSNDKINNKMQKLIYYFELKQFIDKYNNGLDSNIFDISLSGGQLKKIALVRTFLQNAEVIILDEPFVALDKMSQDKLENLINQIVKNKIIIIISHKKNFVFNNMVKLKLKKTKESNIQFKEIK